MRPTEKQITEAILLLRKAGYAPPEWHVEQVIEIARNEYDITISEAAAMEVFDEIINSGNAISIDLIVDFIEDKMGKFNTF